MKNEATADIPASSPLLLNPRHSTRIRLYLFPHTSLRFTCVILHTLDSVPLVQFSTHSFQVHQCCSLHALSDSFVPISERSNLFRSYRSKHSLICFACTVVHTPLCFAGSILHTLYSVSFVPFTTHSHSVSLVPFYNHFILFGGVIFHAIHLVSLVPASTLRSHRLSPARSH